MKWTLNKLEQAESRLLSWGMVDGSFSDDEVIDLADGFLDAHDTCTELESGDELVDLLEERRLLFQFQQGNLMGGKLNGTQLNIAN